MDGRRVSPLAELRPAAANAKPSTDGVIDEETLPVKISAGEKTAAKTTAAE